MDILYTINDTMDNCQRKPVEALENGQVLFFPDKSLSLEGINQEELDESILDGKHKNISYHATSGKLGGLKQELKASQQAASLVAFMQRYYAFTTNIIHHCLPFYQDAIIPGRTSYRPAEIEGRVSSKRKDDTRVHVDAFPASPVNGYRIMRVFCNINFDQKPRVWQVGESLETVIERFYPTVPSYSLLKAKCLNWIKATKTLRSRYDHYMLNIHDNMKLDDNYQQTVKKQTIEFPSSSTWIVFTDQVSHAALQGQHLLEQTFYLPVDAMTDPKKSPLAQLSLRWEALSKSMNA